MKLAKRIIIGLLMVLSIVSAIYTISENSNRFYQKNEQYYLNDFAETSEATYDLAFDALPSIIVKNSNLTIDVKDSKTTKEEIVAKLDGIGGYVTYIYNYNNEQCCRYDMTLKVPQDKCDEFMSYLNGLGDVTNFSESEQDKTKEYKDIERRIKLYETKLAKLYELEDKCDDIGNLLTITNEIENTIYQLEQLHQNEDNLLEKADFCSIDVTVNQDKEEQVKKIDYIAMIKDSFVDSINTFVETVMYIVRIVILLLPFAVVGLLAFLIYRKVKKNKK